MYVALILTKVPALAAGIGRADWSGAALTFGMLTSIATSVGLAVSGVSLPLFLLIAIVIVAGAAAGTLFGRWRAAVTRRALSDVSTERRLIREAETQRQLAEARRNGALRRWKLRSV